MSSPLRYPPSCQVWIDGVRMADGCTPGETPADPVVMTDLLVTWGRSNTIDQPDPGTCTFTILDEGGDPRFMDVIHIGSWVDVKAEASIWLDPETPIFTYDPGFEDGTAGSAPPGGVTAVRSTVLVDDTQAHTGTRSARIAPTTGATVTPRAIFPPAPYGGSTAWDTIPQTAGAGQVWQFGASLYVGQMLGTSLRGAQMRPVAFTAPTATAYTLLDPVLTVPIGTSGWVTLESDFTPPEGVWLGLAVELVPAAARPRWSDVGVGVTWASLGAHPTWDELSAVWVDDLLLLAPEDGGVRKGTVFGGRVTDMTASYDMTVGATMVKVTAQSPLAELNNRYVGEAPWLAETLAARFGRIVDASGQNLAYTVDPAPAAVKVTWRDVDSQPAGDLLSELAQSVGGALWSAHSDITGTYAWLEDIDQRPATHILQMGVDGLIHIVLAPIMVDGESMIVLSACDVLLDPVEWVQTTEDDATQVALTWMNQTKDDDGNWDPTSETITVTDEGAEAISGRRRISVGTQLASYDEALSTANSLLARASTPGWRVDGLTWSVDSTEELDGDTLQRIMTVLDGVTRLGLGLLLVDLPDWSPSRTGEEPLFLEGGRFRNLDGAWTLELLTSSAVSQGKANVRWRDLPGFAVSVRRNLALNPRAVSTGAAGWLTTRGWGTGGAGNYTFGATGSHPLGITTVRLKTWTTAPTNNTQSGFNIAADDLNWFAVVPGQTYTASIWVRYSGSAKQIILSAAFYTTALMAGAATVGSAITSTPVDVAPDTWARVSYTFTAPAGAYGLRLVADTPALATNLWAVGNTFLVTGLLLEAAAAMGSYFDGATADSSSGTVTVDNEWAGTVDASTSTQTTTDTDPAWNWNEFGPEISWNDLQGVGV